MRSTMLTWLRSVLRHQGHQKVARASEDGPPSVADHSYSSDTPLVDPANDRFDRWTFSQRLAITIANRPDDAPLILALYGQWGDGKTTCLNFVEVELLKHPHVVPIRFNPWRFPSETELVVGFFTSLAGALGRSLPTRKEKLGEIIGTYGSIVGAVIDKKDFAETIGHTLSSVKLDELKDRIEEILKQERKRVVVLVDDIDRLEKTEIHAIFRLVKLTAGFRHLIFLLAFDPEIVADALQERYGSSQADAGTKFLDKIVQVPICLPPINQGSLRTFCFQGVDKALATVRIELTEKEVQRFIHAFTIGLETALRTPRMAVRYYSALTFGLPQLVGEVDIPDLLLVEGIRILYPSAYRVIAENKGAFTLRHLTILGRERTSKDPEKNIVDAAFKGIPESERDAIRRLITSLFPRIAGVYGNTYYGPEWDKTWSQEKRIASEDYFDRFFTYSIPAGDVSDLAVDAIIEAAEMSAEEVSPVLEATFTAANADRLIGKIGLRSGGLSQAASIRLASALSARAVHFPNPELLWELSPFKRAALIVSQLIANIPSGPERARSVENILAAAQPLPFGAEVLRCLPTQPGSSLYPFTEDDKAELARRLTQRIEQNSESGKFLFAEFERHAPHIASIWATYGHRDTLDMHIRAHLKADPNNVYILIRSFVPTAYPMGEGLPRRSDFERRQYDFLSAIMDPHLIYHTIESLLPGKQPPDQFPHAIDGASDELLASQFIWLHRFVQASKAPPTTPATL